jgi:hypothetical protein
MSADVNVLQQGFPNLTNKQTNKGFPATNQMNCGNRAACRATI